MTKDDFLVRDLDKIEPVYKTFDGIMYAGLIPTTPFTTLKTNETTEKRKKKKKDGKLMFWLFEPIAPTYDNTLVIWLNGGPGCSSLGGCLFENCPVTIPLHPAGFFGTDQDPAILQPNPYAWTNATRMMYVEQPHGTGFSTGPFPTDEDDLSRYFYHFLQNFYSIFGDDLRSKDLYFFGESYAGMYVPSIAHYIHQRNKERIDPHINLSGIGLGNGWMDARVQGPAVIDYAYWHGIIDSNTAKSMHNEWDNCQEGKAVEFGGDQYTEFHEFTTPDECGIMGAIIEAAGAHQVPWGLPNAYDISTWDP
jgi:carboxypeptidase C (cathepsin A)